MRHPEKQARDPLRHVTDQTADHKPAQTAADVDRWGEGEHNPPRSPVNACQSRWVGSKSTNPAILLPLLLRLTNGVAQRRDAAPATPTCTCYFFQCRGRVTPLPWLYSISISKPNNPYRRRAEDALRSVSFTSSKKHNGDAADRETLWYSHCFLHICAASLPSFMMHHSCIPKNGSTQRGKH